MQQIVKNLFCVYGRFILGLQLVLVSDTTQKWNITMISEKQITYLAKISSGFGVNMSITSDARSSRYLPPWSTADNCFQGKTKV